MPDAPQPQTVRPTQPPRTRDELIALGKTDASWAFLGIAASALQQAPDDHALRWLVAMHLAKLGLGKAAREQLETMNKDVQALPEVQMVQQLATAVGDGVVQPAAIVTRIPGVLAGLPDKLARELTQGVQPLRELLNTHEVMLPRADAARVARGGPASADVRGCIVRPIGDCNLLSWTGGFDAIATAREWVQSRAGKAGQGGCVVVGLCPPQPAFGVAIASKPQPGVPVAKLTIIEPDAARALLGVLLLDDLMPFCAEHVQVLVGSKAAVRFGEQLDKTTNALPKMLLTTPREDTALLGRTLVQQLQKAHERHDDQARVLLQRTQARAQERGESYVRQRFESGLMPGAHEPLRVLLATTRYSTFVQHSTHDIAESLTQLGCHTQVLMEDAQGEQLSALTYLHAIEEMDPDLIVMVNYGRAHIEKIVPSSVPILTIVQDALPNLLSEVGAKAQGPLDMLAGVRMPELVHTFGYSPSRVVPAPVPVSPRKFFRVRVSRGSTAPNIAFISHHSTPPSVLHAEILAQQTTKTDRDVLNALFPVCEQLATQQPWGLKQQLQSATREALMVHGLKTVPHALVSQLMHGYCLRICDRVLRHQMLGWAMEIACEQGLSLALVGNGWEEQEQFARLAMPAVAHGEELRSLYASAGCCLHASMHGVLHQRVFECAMSGGLPLCRTTINAAWPAFSRARALVAQALDGTPMHFDGSDPQATHASWAGTGPGWFAHVHSWPLLRDAIDLVTRFGVPREELVDVNGCVRVLLAHARVQDVDEVASGIVFPASQAFFASKLELEQLVLRAARDSAWRDETSAAIASACEQTVTTDALMARVLAMMVVGDEAVREAAEAQR